MIMICIGVAPSSIALIRLALVPLRISSVIWIAVGMFLLFFMVLWFSGWFVGQRYNRFSICDLLRQIFFRALHPMRYKFLIFAIIRT